MVNVLTLTNTFPLQASSSPLAAPHLFSLDAMRPRRAFVISLAALMLVLPCEAASNRSAHSEVIGTYLNEGRSLIELDLISKDGRETTNIPFSPVVEGAIK